MILFVLVAVVLLGACESLTKYKITGNAADFEDGRGVYLVTVIDDEIAILDSTVVKNHSFILKGEVKEPCWAKIAVLESLETSDGIIIEFILEPGRIVFADFGVHKLAEEQAQSVAPGNTYKNVEGNDAAGKKLSLKEVVENKKNKFVLLDFWATWCGPCMNELPHLKAAYQKYHNMGFEIYALSIDHDSDAWTKVVKEKELQWVNVLREGNEATEFYGVRGIPSNYLIDSSTGTIVATHLRGEALLKKLQELIE